MLIHIRLGGIFGYGEKRKPVNPDSDKDARSSERRKVKPAAANPLWEKAILRAGRPRSQGIQISGVVLSGRSAGTPALPGNPNPPPASPSAENGFAARDSRPDLGSREKFPKAPVLQAPTRTEGESRCSLLSLLSENRASAIFLLAIDIAAPGAYHVSTA